MELGVSHVQSLSSSTPVVDNIFDKYNKNLVPIRSLSDHDIYKVVIATRQIYIATGQMYIATRQIYIATGQIYDLMSDKYITSLLLIKMLKAFLRVNIKS